MFAYGVLTSNMWINSNYVFVFYYTSHFSPVVERAFRLADASKKCQLLSELYSPEPQLFQDLSHGDGER